MPTIRQLNIQRQLTAKGLDITLEQREILHFVAAFSQIVNRGLAA